METTTKPSSTQVVLKMAAFFAVATILIVFIEFYSGLLAEGKTWLILFPLVVNGTVGFIFTKKFRDEENGGNISLGGAFMIVFKAYVAGGFVATIFQYIFNNYLHPDVVQKQLDAARQLLVSKGMSDDQIDASLKMSTSLMSNPAYFLTLGVVGAAFWGAVVGLVIALILKNEKEEFPVN